MELQFSPLKYCVILHTKSLRLIKNLFCENFNTEILLRHFTTGSYQPLKVKYDKFTSGSRAVIFLPVNNKLHNILYRAGKGVLKIFRGN